MLIILRLKTFKIFIAILIVILFGAKILLLTSPSKPAAAIDDEFTNQLIEEEIDRIITLRNQAILDKDTDILSSLYNKKLRNGLWAYEHAYKKMKYLHSWAEKQSVEFIKITSDIKIRNPRYKGEGYTMNLLVSTEYQYVYQDTEDINTFRIGTYHVLDIMPEAETYVVSKEWYTDPFADSLSWDETKTQEIKEIIKAGQAKDLSDLHEKRKNAVEYADKYCGAASLPEYGYKYNHDYRNFNPEGGDCANFASQMLHEGGGFRKNGTWNYANGSGSRAWLNASGFNSYMIYSGRGSLIVKGTYDKVLKLSYKLLPGDYVAYEKKGKVSHISVVTGLDSKGYPLVNSHNSDRYRVPFDLGWSNKGIKFWLVRVHY